MKCILFLFGIIFSLGLKAQHELENQPPYIQILGITQDAGFPQINCQRNCCDSAWLNAASREWVASLAIVCPSQRTYYIIDATPDFKYQMHMMNNETGFKLGGIFLTHAHMGHYTGLMDLGLEALGAQKIPVYAMPRMYNYLSHNGPWSQLVHLNNIELLPLEEGKRISLHSISIIPHTVPHRDEFSETVGYEIQGPKKSAWYIPDIDKWHLWDKSILDQLDKDYLIIDGTFYRNGEIWGRDMSEIPHPFIEESMNLFEGFSEEVKSKVIFTHFNHTNPVMWDKNIRKQVRSHGFQLAQTGMVMQL